MRLTINKNVHFLIVATLISSAALISSFTSVSNSALLHGAIANNGGIKARLKTSKSTSAFVTFSFTIAHDASTSAGVFADDGSLVRTLWSGVKYTAGSYNSSWDGTNDDGELAPDGNYSIRVLSSNVSYTWEGVVGNTSDTYSGPSVHNGMEGICSMTFSGNQGYYANNYNEQRGSCFKFSIQNPQEKTTLIGWGINAQFVATDGNIVYWGGNDPFNASKWVVYGTSTADDSELGFSAGTGFKTKIARAYKSVLDTVNRSNADISGLAVQKTGNCLFVAHQKLNEIHVLNKATGAQLRILKFTSPQSIVVDGRDNLWVIYTSNGGPVAEKFAVNPDGTLTSSHVIINGLIDPLAIAVSPDNNTVIVADGGASQQLKAFNNSAAAPLWTFGQSGGYSNGPDVSNDKFYFSDARGRYATFVAFQPDGSFWVDDAGNNRAQHFNADRTFINRIQYTVKSYSASADPADPTRLFSDYLEYKIDYSKPLSPSNGSWTLVKNWGHEILPVDDDNFNKLKCVTTLSNRHTYALLYNHVLAKWLIVELPQSGPLRVTGIQLDNNGPQLYPDGSLRRMSRFALGKPTVWTKKTLTGFDQSNNPLWGDEAEIASSPPAASQDPGYWGNAITLRSGEVSASNVIIAFDGGLPPNGGDGFHLGGVRLGDNKWLWRTAMSTIYKYSGPYPADGAYDIGNSSQYAGSVALAVGRNIIWGFHGEFYKSSEVNKWNHVYDDGLFIGQFGVIGNGLGLDAPAMMAGNSFAASLVQTADGGAYLYHNDESYHSGVHRWKINGLSTIAEQAIPVKLSVTGHGLLGQYFDGTDLDNIKIRTVRNDQVVNFNWGNNAPSNTGISNPQNFSVSWNGFVEPLYSEGYSFSTNAASGVRLWVNGKLLIDNWNGQSVSASPGTVGLTAGHRYPVRIEYFKNSASGTMSLSWSSQSQPLEIIPASRLFSSLPIDRSTRGIDLMENLPFNSVLENNLYGWTRNPVNDINKNPQSNWWSGQTNVKTYQRFQSPDLYVKYRQQSGVATITRNLSTDNRQVNSWQLSGNVSYDGNTSNSDGDLSEKGNGGSFFEVLDDKQKIILRIFIHIDYTNHHQVMLFANNKVIVQDNETALVPVLNSFQPISISMNNGMLTFKYGKYAPVTSAAFDAAANALKPTTLRLYFWMNGSNYNRIIDLKNLYYQFN